MKRLTSKIKIGKYFYTGIVESVVESSYETLTDTCKLIFPRKVQWQGIKITDIIKVGDNVSIELGYDDNNQNVFDGYIKTIKASIPVEITCEDNMMLLKKNAIKKSFNKIDLKQLLINILPQDMKFKCIDFIFSNFRIDNATPSQVLDTLYNDFGLRSFFKNNILYVGLNVWAENSKKHYFSFQKDIIDPNNLEFVSAEDTMIKVVATSIDDKNNRVSIEVGNKDGEQRTFFYYNINKAELEKIANNELEKLKFSGYKGSFQTFGEPFVKHGDVVVLSDKLYPEREGAYIVKSVNYTYNTSGYRQTINLDRLWK